MAHNVQWGGERTIKLFRQKKAYYEQVTQDQWNSKVQSQFIHSKLLKIAAVKWSVWVPPLATEDKSPLLKRRVNI